MGNPLSGAVKAAKEGIKEVASNASVKSQGIFKTGKNFTSRMKTAGEDMLEQSVTDINNFVDKNGKEVFNLNTSKVRNALGYSAEELNNVSEAGYSAISNQSLKSAEEMKNLTKDQIEAAMKDAQLRQKINAGKSFVKDFVSQPIQNIKSTDLATKQLGWKQAGARYGAMATVGAGAVGVVHDMASDDESDWGLKTVVGAGAIGGSMAGAGALISKFMKV